MSYSSNLIKAPVSIYDVQQAAPVTLSATVGGTTVYASSNDVGVLCGAKAGDTIVGTYTDPTTGTVTQNITWTVVSRVGINKWARWKPVQVQQITSLSYTQLVFNLHFGFDIIFYHGTMSGFGQLLSQYAQTEFKNVTTQYSGYKDGVKYNYPTTHFRLTDFACIENQSRYGYKSNAQLLWNQPGTSHAIASAIGDGAQIDLATVDDYQQLPDDSTVFNETNLNIDISQQTNANYGSISAPEILKAHGYTGGGFRGLTLTDGYGGVAYTCIDSIPWATWKTDVQEAVLFGDWYYLEFYTNANPAYSNPTGDFYLIPGLMGSCTITTGSGGQGGIQFMPSPDNGLVSYSSSLGKYASHVEFARVTGQQVNEWNLTVIVNKDPDGTSSQYYTNNITNLSSYTSGYTWYYFDFGIDLGTIDNYGDTFELVIQGTRKNVSEATRVVHRSRFVLTQ